MFGAVKDDCFSNIEQDFLVCTTIHKARNIAVFTAETFIRVTLDKTRKQTKKFANSENPWYNEYFVFELTCTFSELQRMTILYELKKRISCRKSLTLGELLIDLQSVWIQQNHCFFKKWGRLERPLVSNESNVEFGRGYLQIDLAIVTQSTKLNSLLKPFEDESMSLNKWQINQDYDDIEKNLLQHFDDDTKCNMRYNIVFISGVMAKKADYMLQFRFNPYKGRTQVCKSTTKPFWNLEISFSWIYPSLAQIFFIQILMPEHLQWRCVAEYELHFDEIAFKDKPTLGPTFLHFYDTVNTLQYIGRVLIEVRSERSETDLVRELTVNSVPVMADQRYWQNETFTFEFVPLRGHFIHGNHNKCNLTLRFAEHNSNQLTCTLKNYNGKFNGISTNVKYFIQEVPFKSLHIKCELPDNRHKFDSDYFIHEILEYMKTEIEIFKLFQLKFPNQIEVLTKGLKGIIINFQNKVKDALENKRLEYTGFDDQTAWDFNRLIYLQEVFNKFHMELNDWVRKLKAAHSENIEAAIDEVYLELVQRCNELTNILAKTRVQDEWPDLLLVLSSSSNKELAVCRLNAKYYLNTPQDKEKSTSNCCWRIKNFVFKEIQCTHNCINCGCNFGIIIGTLGIVVDIERSQFMRNISHDWQQPETFQWTPTIPTTLFKCRIFLHQAKIRPSSNNSGLCDPHLRLIFGDYAIEIPTQFATFSPIWNAVVTIESIDLPGTLDWYFAHPPLVALELYDTDKQTADDYLGCGMLSVSVISSQSADANAREEPESPRRPGEFYHQNVIKTRQVLQKFQKLKCSSPSQMKWIAIAVNGGVSAEVLISAELIELQSAAPSNFDSGPTTTFGIPTAIRPNMKNYVFEVIFAGWRNYTKNNAATSTTGRQRVKVMMGDLVLMSGPSASRIKNSINFLVLYDSGVLSLSEQLEYWPAIIVTDVAISARGTETTVGAALISHTKRFLQQDKKINFVPIVEPDDAESNQSMISFQLEDTEDEEKRTLLPNDKKKTILERVIGLFSSKSQLAIEQAPPTTAPTAAPVNSDMRSIINEKEFTWWTKYYSSMYTDATDGAHLYKHKLYIYANELERQSEFSYLHDWAEPFQLVHGVKEKKHAALKESVYGTLKMQIKLTPCHCGQNVGCGDGVMLRPLATALNPNYQAKLSDLANVCRIIVRVYVVQGLQLRSHDKHNQFDCYVNLRYGSRTFCNRAQYVPNESNPIFGKSFQLEGDLPGDHILEVTLFDRSATHDEIIGSTFIDIEDRWRTKHRATIGLAKEYSRTGYNKWRDVSTPIEILLGICANNEITPPKFNGKTIEVDGVTFKDKTRIATAEDLQERLSLTVLQNFDKLPSFGYKLVPEHVETRSLYLIDYPGIEQGKIQMWVELYEDNVNIPPPIDISPIPPQTYELRVVVLNTADVLLQEQNIFGAHMSDITVKGWCHDSNSVQTTDIHYRSLDGQGNFNWRMIFPLKYSIVEDMMVAKQKISFIEEYECKKPPILSLQILDTDILSHNGFLGALEINLSNFPEPYADRKSCIIPAYTTNEQKSYFSYSSNAAESLSSRKLLNLFREKHVHGWFPFRGILRKNEFECKEEFIYDAPGITGKIELDLEICTDVEAGLNPAGLGREPPQALALPVRPETSFNPFLHPFKSFRKVVFPAIRIYILYGLLSALFLLGVVAFFTDAV